MLAKISFLTMFVGLPVWGSYTGNNLLGWALAGLAMIAFAAGCLLLHIKLQEVGEVCEKTNVTHRRSGTKKGA